MICFNPHSVTQSKVTAERKKSPAKHKRPLQVSEEIHSLISQMAKDRNLSLEQVVGKAVIKEARAALDTPDGDKQRLYLSLTKNAEQELRGRYVGEKSRRSAQMRRINDQRRKKSATPASASASSFSRPPRPVSPYSGYPIKYRYGIAVPEPPPSSYPTYY
ncbi:hypothetical protein IJH72_03020 [Candidatus Saccharibacteria bacterium]|nr:hypothetical protein [Candidatus Saccharibacteria bacterium]